MTELGTNFVELHKTYVKGCNIDGINLSIIQPDGTLYDFAGCNIIADIKDSKGATVNAFTAALIADNKVISLLLPANDNKQAGLFYCTVICEVSPSDRFPITKLKLTIV